MWGLRPAPALRETHCWCLFVEDVQSPALLKAYESILSPDERRQVYSADSDRVRRERLLSCALVRTTLARYSSGLTRPESLKFSRNEFGKPHLLGATGLCFSLSHTSSLISCAVSSHSELGIDVEDKDRVLVSDVMRLARRRLPQKEVSWLEGFGSSADEQRRRFIQLWTLKEAYVKALGRGISGAPLKNFAFTFDPVSPGARLSSQLRQHPQAQSISLESEESGDNPQGWQFLLFEPSQQQYSSICMQRLDGDEEDRDIKFWKTVPLVEDAALSDGAVALAWSASKSVTEKKISSKTSSEDVPTYR